MMMVKGNGRQSMGKDGRSLSPPSIPHSQPQSVALAPTLTITRSKTFPKKSSLPTVGRVFSRTVAEPTSGTQVTLHRSSWSCMTTATASTDHRHRKLDHGTKNSSSLVSLSSELSPTMGYHLSRQSFSNPTSPNFYQNSQKPFDFDQTTSTSCQRVNNIRPTPTSRFGRTANHHLHTQLNSSQLLSRSLSPPRNPHGHACRSSTTVQTSSKSSLNIFSELRRPPVVSLKPKDYQSCNCLASSSRGNNGRKKQISKGGTVLRKGGSPTSRFFPVLATTSECQQTEERGTTGKNVSERWQIKGEPGIQQIRGTGVGANMNYPKGRDEASPSRSTKTNEECFRMVELRRSLLEAENDMGRGSVDSDSSVSSSNLRRISNDVISTSSPASLRARMSLLGKSLSIDTNTDNPIPCRDFGIKDYLTMTGESIDNEEESSFAGDFGAGLGVIPPRFSIDSIDSQMAILQELKETRNSFSMSSSSTSASPFKETYRRYSEDIGMLSSTAQRRNQSFAHAPMSPSALVSMDMDARNHGDPNLCCIDEDSDSNRQPSNSEGRPPLHKSLSLAHPPNVISRSTLPKIQEDRCAILGSQGKRSHFCYNIDSTFS
ncbi:hypothetical protein CHUAL_000558 [Chamberlinius hualienensis]